MSITLILIVAAVMVLMWKYANRKLYSYKCIQCGTANGEHSKECSFHKLDDE